MRHASLPTWIVCSFVGCALVACGGAIEHPPALDGGDARPTGFVRVVTWNVHDVFDEMDRTAAPGADDLVPSAAEVSAKLSAVGKVLARIDPDVAILQEVENEALLRRLASGPLAGRPYGTFLREGYDPRGIDVGILSRLPFQPGKSHLEERGPDGRHLWARDPVEILLPLEPAPLAVVGVHLISRLDPDNDERRRLQATRLREIADGLRHGPTAPIVIVAGDLNDLPVAPALAPLLADGSWVDLGHALPTLAAWTWAGDGLHERMDYALISAADRPLVTRVAVEEGPDVAAASDHRPLVVDLWLGHAE